MRKLVTLQTIKDIRPIMVATIADSLLVVGAIIYIVTNI
jgi:hypothetical protein